MSAADYDKSPRHSSPGRRDLDRNRSRSPGASRRSHGPARSPDRAPADRERSNSTNTGTNLFVSGLSMDVRNEDLEGIFSKYGKVLKCEVMFDPRTRESRGFGFVNFANVEDADDALTLNGADLLGRPLMVQKARRQRPRTPTPGEYRGPIKEILYDRRRDDRYSRGGRSSDHDPYASRERFDRPRDRYDSRERDYEREYDRYNGRGGGDRYDREGDRGRRW